MFYLKKFQVDITDPYMRVFVATYNSCFQQQCRGKMDCGLT